MIDHGHRGDASSWQHLQTLSRRPGLQAQERDECRQFEACVADQQEPRGLEPAEQMSHWLRQENLAYDDSFHRGNRDGASLDQMTPLGADLSREILLCCRLPYRRQNRWCP